VAAGRPAAEATAVTRGWTLAPGGIYVYADPLSPTHDSNETMHPRTSRRAGASSVPRASR